MSTVLQIRNVPDELHRRLKARAAIEGLSMSELVLREIRKALDAKLLTCDARLARAPGARGRLEVVR